jgi:hypothetical protein
MSTNLVEKEIGRFLRSAQPEVLCISGAWGTGKTHTWKDQVSALSVAGQIALQSYSYCSLFGINSVGDLKQAIWENTIPSNAKATPANVLMEKLQLLEAKRKAISTAASAVIRDVTQKFGGTNVANLLVQSSFWFVRDQIVVVDDIERKGKDLTIDAVLGLLLDLREQRQCKVALILNDEQLDEIATYRKYTEKVIERYLAFKPLAAECVDKATRVCDGVKLVRNDCIALELTNIRVIVRIAKIAELIIAGMGRADDRVKRHALKMVSVFCWMTMTSDAAPLEFMDGRSQRRILEQIDKNAKSSDSTNEPRREIVWHALLDKLDVPTISQFDIGVLDGIRDGFFNPKTLESLVEHFEASLRTSDAEAAFTGAWDLFHVGFVDNEVEFVEALESSIRVSSPTLSPDSMDASVNLLRDLGRSELADSLIEHYVEKRSDIEKDLGEALRPITRVSDDRLLDAIKRKAESQRKRSSRTIAEIIKELGATPSNHSGLDAIARGTPEEVASGLKSLRGLDLRSALEILSSPERPEVRKVLGQALEQIASESSANRVRVGSWIKGGFEALITDGVDRAGPIIEYLERRMEAKGDPNLVSVLESLVESLSRDQKYTKTLPGRLQKEVERLDASFERLRNNETEWSKMIEWAKKKQFKRPGETTLRDA